LCRWNKLTCSITRRRYDQVAIVQMMVWWMALTRANHMRTEAVALGQADLTSQEMLADVPDIPSLKS
jgi:hypothetical protein